MADKEFFEKLQQSLLEAGLKVSKQGTKAIFGICVGSVFTEVKKTGSVRLPSGFGAMKIRHLAATKKKSPHSDVIVDVPTRDVCRYIMGKTVKAMLNT